MLPAQAPRVKLSKAMLRAAHEDRDAVKKLVVDFHYSHRMPSNCQYYCCAYWNDVVVAGVSFGLPQAKWAESLLELNRLVCVPDFTVPLTWLISQTVKAIRRDARFDLLISYADATQNHHGGVYQAASWNYHQQRKPCIDGLVVNGVFVPGRTCNARWKTRSPQRLRFQYPTWDIQPHVDCGKHLYWLALTPDGEAKASRLGFMKKDYPKPNAVVV